MNKWNRVGFGRARARLALGLVVMASAAACSIRSNGPNWIETHGRAQVQRLAGGPLGLLAIGTNGLVYSYPEFGSIWHEWNNRLRPRIVVGSRRGLAYAEQDGQVGQGNRGRVNAPEWSLGAGVSALATDEDGRTLYAIANGRISTLLSSGAVAGPCPDLHAVSIAVADGQLWVSDAQRVYLASDAACQPIAGAPAQVTHLAALGKRVFASDQSGDIFRRTASGAWEKLPRPKKFRPDRLPQLRPVTDVAVTGTAAWALDDEGNVFVLSESE